MYFTYVLESDQGNHWYFGVTNNINRRISEHNSGKSAHANKYKPWKLRFCASFIDRPCAEKFEKYLKSHAGRAWMSKHLSSS
jgi:putative endonuclease